MKMYLPLLRQMLSAVAIGIDDVTGSGCGSGEIALEFDEFICWIFCIKCNEMILNQLIRC